MKFGRQLAHPASSRPAPVTKHGAGGGPGGLEACHQPPGPGHCFGQQPGVGGVLDVSRHHGGVGADFSRLYQLRLDRFGQQRLVERGDRLVSAPGGDLHQGGRVRHFAVNVDAAEPAPRDRIGHLGAQGFVAQPVAVLEEHQPQVGFHRHARPAQHGVEMRPKRGEEPLVVKPLIHPGQLCRKPQTDLRQHRLPQRRLHVPRPQHDRSLTAQKVSAIVTCNTSQHRK